MDHLKDVRMTYRQHMAFALRNAMKLLMAGIALVIHAVFPNCLVDTSSTIVKQVFNDFEKGKKE
jgi:hypothetical protein